MKLGDGQGHRWRQELPGSTDSLSGEAGSCLHLFCSKPPVFPRTGPRSFTPAVRVGKTPSELWPLPLNMSRVTACSQSPGL